MHTCERCGTRFGRVPTSESCPRCLARDGVRVALAFQYLDPEGSAPRRSARSEGLEAAVRGRLQEAAQGRGIQEVGRH
jgi:hypothetical protein